jgi:hypothetical protein
MIPKIIHYCWFGNGELPEKDKKCIESWKKFCPDYEIVLWNENNYDVSKNNYMKQAYDEKKWGFVPDVARLDIIYNYGGIYVDTDVEFIACFDDLLDNNGFAGFEDGGNIALGLGFGAEKGNQVIKRMLDFYDGLNFINEDGSLNVVASPFFSTKVFEAEGFKMDNTFQKNDNFTIYPSEVFCPMDNRTGVINITNRTKSIHWYNASWISTEKKREREKERELSRKYGMKAGAIFFKIYKYALHPKRLFLRIINGDDLKYKEYTRTNKD